jgi:hypothetical protein
MRYISRLSANVRRLKLRITFMYLLADFNHTTMKHALQCVKYTNVRCVIERENYLSDDINPKTMKNTLQCVTCTGVRNIPI